MKIRSQSQLNLFLIIAGAITLAFLVINYINMGVFLNSESLSATYLFGDYFSHMGYSSLGDGIYAATQDACLPPLAYCCYYLLWRMAPSYTNSAEIFWEDFKNSDNTALVFLMMNLVLVILLIWIILQYFRRYDGKYILALPIIILFSYPCMFTSLQRGNSALAVALLLAIVWLWLDDKSAVKREVALILIAVATGFKIYPAILGIVLIKRKDWKAVLRLIIYGAILFFGPFVFYGGVEGIKTFFETMFSITQWTGVDHYGTVRGMSIYLLREHTALTAAQAESAGYVLETLFLVASLSFFFLAKRKWEEVILLSAILVSYVGSNAHYTFAYYIPALLMFLRENESNGLFGEHGSAGGSGDADRRKNGGFLASLGITLITVMFAIIFSCPFFWPKGIYMGVSVAGYCMWCLTVFEVILVRRK